jgi:hypothetical protein
LQYGFLAAARAHQVVAASEHAGPIMLVPE